MDDLLVWVVLCSAVVGLGVAVASGVLVSSAPRLGDAIGVLDGHDTGAREIVLGEGWDARLGRFAYTRLHLPVGPTTLRRLELQGRTPADFLAEKVLLALAGLALPQLFTLVTWLFGRPSGATPLLVSLAGGVVGYLWPDWALRRHVGTTLDAAAHDLVTLFDLVTLERLANQSATASLQSAVRLSDALVFRRVRTVVDRARLEQRAPWRDLHALADELGLPELHDLADVLQLEEQGAALADTLRARAVELRDAHLLRERLRAERESESMTVWMVIPSFVLGALLVAPPLLRLLGSP